MKSIQLKTLLKQYEPFLNGVPLSDENNAEGESCFQSIRHLSDPEELKKVSTKSEIQAKAGDYFIFEIGFKYNRNNFSMSHIFKLDLTSLEIELKKKLGDESIENYIDPEKIAIVLERYYPENCSFINFFNEAGNDDYAALAQLMIDNKGFASSKKFGF